MMKLILEAVPRSVALIAGLVFLAALIGVAAFAGSWLAATNASPVVYTSSGLMVKHLEGMGKLATVRVNIVDVLSAEGDGYKGSWLIKGDAVLACDMSAAHVADVDEQSQTATIELPLPVPVSPRVDHSKTKTWSVKRTTWIPFTAGNQDAFRDGAMYHAQRLVEKAAGSDENIGVAKTHTELLVRKTFEMVGWTVDVRWQGEEAEQMAASGSK